MELVMPRTSSDSLLHRVLAHSLALPGAERLEFWALTFDWRYCYRGHVSNQALP